MNNKIRKALSLLIALGMLSSTVPQVLAENDLEADAAVSVDAALDSTVESEEQSGESEEQLEEDYQGNAELLASDNPGMLVDLSFDDKELGDFLPNADDFATGKDGAQTFDVIEGSQLETEIGAGFGREGRLLKIEHVAPSTNQKVRLAPLSIGENAAYGERTLVTAYEFMSSDQKSSLFELTMAGGNSGADINGGFRVNGKNMQVFANSGDQLKATNAVAYDAKKWQTIVILTHIDANNNVTGSEYYLNGTKVNVEANSFGDKGKAPNRLRMVFNKDLTAADLPVSIYLDNMSVVDVRPALDSLTQKLMEDGTVSVADYIAVGTDQLTLPKSFNGASLVWESSNKEVINTDEIAEDGTVAVKHIPDNADVTLTAKVRIEGMYGIEYPDSMKMTAENGLDFKVTVQSSSGEETDESKAQRIANAITFEQTVSGNFELPTTTQIVESGAEITWSSKDTSTISVTGANATVTRPAFDAENKEAVITATVKYGAATATKDFTVTVIRNEGPITPEEDVRYAVAMLGSLGFKESAPKTSSISLDFLEKIGNATLTWESSDQEWLSNDGIIVKNPEKGEGKHDVNVKVTITSGSATQTLNYVISIKPMEGAKAYPGAQGYGTQTRGGAGGYVYHVTTLAPDGEGSFKYGVENCTGARTIVFDVGGTIDLTSIGRALALKGEQGSNVTIAGQTAPGEGIQLKGYGLNLSSVEDVIIRNLKIRIGNVRKAGDTYQSDPMSVSGTNKRVVLDHISMNWNVDMGFRVYGNEITMSNCLITKAMYYNTPHEKGKHNYAGMFSPKYGSFYNNYIADMGQRAPRIIDNEYIDVRNNVVYNCKYSFDICNYEWMGANTKFNIVNNAVLMGDPENASTTSGGSYKYFQGRTYSGGIISYTANNIDKTKEARSSISKHREGALWTAETSNEEKRDVIIDELGVISRSGYSNEKSEWHNMVLPDDMSLAEYNTSAISYKGNTLVNYPFAAPEVKTLDPEEATKYVLENAGAIYPVDDTLNTRYKAEGRTRLKVESDYSTISKKQGIKLTDADLAKMTDPTTAYGLPVQTHTTYVDANGGEQYDVDGKNVTDTTGLTVKETFKFVTNPENHIDTLYAYDTKTSSKYRIVLDSYEDPDGIYDKFEIYDVNNNKLEKPAAYESAGSSSGITYKLNGSDVTLKYSEWGDGPGNYSHSSDYDDPYGDSSFVDTEWSDTDWPNLPTVYRDSKEDKEANPSMYGNNGRFDTNNDGIPDYYVTLMGWDKLGGNDSNKDISREDFDGDGYTNLEEYINDYLCGDVEVDVEDANDPVVAENVHDGSSRFNTHRSHQIIFNTARRAKAQVFYSEGDSVDINTAERIDLNRYYDTTNDNYITASDFETYFSVIFPNVTNMTDASKSLKPGTKYSYVIKTYSDTGVEYLSDTYSFTTSEGSAEKPGTPRVTKYVPYDQQIMLTFEPYSPLKGYSQYSSDKIVTTIEAPQYDSSTDHYVIRYSTNADMSDAKEVTISGNATSYTITGLTNETDYYVDLRAVNKDGVESDSAVYNFKKVEEQDVVDKDGNKTYAVKDIQVVGNTIQEYFYDSPLKDSAITPTKYVLKADYEQDLAEAGIGNGETAKFITYYGDVEDWYIYTLGGIPIPTKDQYSDNRLMLMLRDDNHDHGFNYAKTFDTPLSGKSTIKFRIKVNNETLDPMNQNPELRIYLQEDIGGDSADEDDAGSDSADSTENASSFGTVASITFAKNEINYNGDSIARYTDNTWYEIEMRLDGGTMEGGVRSPNAKTCSVYINGQLVASDLEYSNFNDDGVSAIRKWQISSRLAGTEDVYIDYMHAYSGWDETSSGNVVEPGTSGSRPSGGGGGGSSSGKQDPIILGGDFNSSPKVDKDGNPAATEAPSSGSVNSQFNDMGTFAWAVPAVNALYEKGVVTGVGNNCFAPDRAVTRAEFITMLMRGFELVGDTATCDYTDIKDGDWCYDAIAMASSMGIVNGLPDGSFGVNQEISRQDMSVMCVRLAQAIGLQLSEKSGSESFADYDEISDYAKESVDMLSKSGIVNGTGDGKFSPKGTANRAQAAKIIYEMIAVQQ